MKKLEQKTTGYRYNAIQFTKENQDSLKEFLGKTANIYIEKILRTSFMSDEKSIEYSPIKMYFTTTYTDINNIKKIVNEELSLNDWIVKKCNDSFEIYSDNYIRTHFNILDSNENDFIKEEPICLNEIFLKQADSLEKHNILISDSSTYKLTLNKHIFLEKISIGITTGFLRQLNDYIDNGFITLTEKPSIYVGEYPNPVLAFIGNRNRNYYFGAFDLLLESGNWSAQTFRFDSGADFLNQLKTWNSDYKIYLLKMNVGKYIEVRLIKIPYKTDKI